MIHGQRLEVLEQLLALDARQLADLARREVRQILVGGHALPGALGDLLKLVLHSVISEAGAERPLRERVAPTDDLEAAQLHIASLRLAQRSRHIAIGDCLEDRKGTRLNSSHVANS